MASESILTSYLMSIGFKIDEEGYRKFKETQEDSDKRNQRMRDNLEKFAATAAAAAGVLSTSVIKISDRLNALYYSSELAGSSAKNLGAFKSAAEQIGISADQASSVVQNLGTALRTMPGLSGILQSMNINPDQDKVQVLLDLVDKLSKLPYYQAVQYAKLFGIDETTLKLMEDHREELGKLFAKYQELNKGTQQQTEEARKFHNALADLETRFSKLWDIIANRFMPVGEKLLGWLSSIIDALIGADKATDGWSSRLLGVVSALASVIGSVKGLKTVMKILGLGTAEEAGAAGTAAAGGAGVGALGAAGAVGVGLTGVAFESLLASPTLQKKFSDKFAGTWLYNLIYGSPLDTTNAPHDALMDHPTSSVPLHNPGNLRSAPGTSTVERFRGKTSIGRFAQFGSDQEGLRAMANLLEGPLYAGGGRNTISDIISRYAPSSENDTSSYIGDVAKRMGVGSKTKLDLSNFKVLSSLMEAMIHKEQGKDPFSMSMIEQAAQFRLGQDKAGTSVTINQNPKVDIHVNGAKDPQSVAKDVLDGQERVNAKMQRDGQGVIR